MGDNKRFKEVVIALIVIGVVIMIVAGVRKEKTKKTEDITIKEITEVPVDTQVERDKIEKENKARLYVNGYDVPGSQGDGKPVILAFGAEWCPSCKQMLPDIEEVHKKYSDRVTIRYIDVDKMYDEMYENYPIEVVPTIFFFDGEKEPLAEAEYMGQGTGWILRADTPDRETQKHILTGHQGYMNKEAFEMIIESWGIEVD